MLSTQGRIYWRKQDWKVGISNLWQTRRIFNVASWPIEGCMTSKWTCFFLFRARIPSATTGLNQRVAIDKIAA